MLIGVLMVGYGGVDGLPFFFKNKIKNKIRIRLIPGGA